MTFQEFVEDLGYETRSYSGRGMYGKECFAITVDSPYRAIQEIAYELGLNNGGDDDEAIPAPRNVAVDNMGTQYVVYWPGVSFTE